MELHWIDAVHVVLGPLQLPRQVKSDREAAIGDEDVEPLMLAGVDVLGIVVLRRSHRGEELRR